MGEKGFPLFPLSVLLADIRQINRRKSSLLHVHGNPYKYREFHRKQGEVCKYIFWTKEKAVGV